ncbi:MAG: winged helix-turn-helix transcriptional regulator, partial [Bdellovibrionales bacterium]|nr:winged helix-turn-helix transcriptional regulator [Bdellovibrionales bacterium]
RSLLHKSLVTPQIRFAAPTLKYQLQPEDEALLEALSNTDAVTIQQLSAATGIPGATVDRRKRALEEQGVIRSYVYWIDSSMLGRQMYVFRISTRGFPVGLRDKLFQFAANESLVVYALRTIGQWDFELGVEVSTAQQVSHMTQRIHDVFQTDVVSVQPIPVVRYHKVVGYPKR